MRQPCLNSLVLTEQEMEKAEQQIREMAYFKWLNAGCPEGDNDLVFWNEAEREWTEYYYVPHRNSVELCEA